MSRLAALALAALAAGPGPAAADTLMLRTGDLLTGRLELTALTLATPGGAVRLARTEVFQVVLGTASGDAVHLLDGRVLAGVLEHPALTLILDSGQRLTVPRDAVAAAVLTPPR